MKVFLLAATLLGVINICQAQNNPVDDDSRSKLQFGLKIGGNYSNVYDTKGENFNHDARLGAAMGVFLSVPIGKFIGVQPEALFSQRGFKGTGTLLGSNYGLTRTSNFIDVPILLAIKPVKFLTILAGPQYSYLLSQKDVFVTSTSTVEQQDVFKNDNIRKNILCVNFGADINIQNFVISARAGSDMMKNNGDGTSATPRYKNMWYQATVGYRF
jgi:Outer membrane protein beta-barrel domain